MISEILEKGILQLQNAGVENPRLDAEVLLAHALGCERFELYTSSKCQELTADTVNQYFKRRCNREPVAYIIGYKEFWSLKIKVTKDVLIPRPETEALVEKTLDIFHSRPTTHDSLRILDLCTGSGAITVALATEIPNAQFTVSDLSEAALQIAKQNLKFAENRITFIHSDLFEKIEGKFDFIVSNPPYIPSAMIATLSPEVLHEPHSALNGGFDGLAFTNKIRQDALQFLKPNGWLIMESGAKVEACKNS